MIVMGVLIALAASDWQQERLERRVELDLLAELRTALSSDLAALEAQRERYQRIGDRVTTLLVILQSGAPYADSLDAYFGTLYGIDAPMLNRAAGPVNRSETLTGSSLVSIEQHLPVTGPEGRGIGGSPGPGRRDAVAV